MPGADLMVVSEQWLLGAPRQGGLPRPLEEEMPSWDRWAVVSNGVGTEVKSTGDHPAQGLVAGGVAGRGREHPEVSATIGSRGLTRRRESGEREKFQVVRSCSRPGAGDGTGLCQQSA